MVGETGRVVTFYSYKGGVGRSFLLANVAVTLANWGFRVLCIDWDLEAPGLAHYFGAHLAFAPVSGVVDLAESVLVSGQLPWDSATVPVDTRTATFHLLPAGSAADYERRVQDLDWERLYDDHGFGELLERARDEMKAAYDFVLVDSRTGVSDVGGICAVQLPDVLMMVLGANEQNLDGTDAVASRICDARDRLAVDRLALPIVPILSRFDSREERILARDWQRTVADRLAKHMQLWKPDEIAPLDFVEQAVVPYVAHWSFGERLPVLDERTRDPESISWSIETIAAIVANGPERVDELIESRDGFVTKARSRSIPEHVYDIFISSGALDADKAHALASRLRERGMLVYLPSESATPGSDWRAELDTALVNSLNLVVLAEGSLRRDQSAEVRNFLGLMVDRTDDSRIVVVNLSSTEPDLPSILRERATVPWTNVYRVGDEVIAALGLSADQVERWEAIARQREWILGSDHHDTLQARARLAKSLTDVGRLGDALAEAERVMDDRLRLLGTDHPETLSARFDVMASLMAAGRSADALPLAEHVLADRQRVLGPDHPDTLTSGNSVAVCLAQAGRYVDALSLAEQVVTDSERVLGPVHPDTLRARNNLANRLAEVGRTDEALTLAEKVAIDRQRVVGPDHPDTLSARNNLANRLAANDRNADALTLCEQVVTDFQRVVGPDHPDTLGARFNLSILLAANGRNADALNVAEQIVPDYQRVLGPDHPDTLSVRNNLTVRLAANDRLAEAVNLSEQLLIDDERILGPDHPDTTRVRNNLELFRRRLIR